MSTAEDGSLAAPTLADGMDASQQSPDDSPRATSTEPPGVDRAELVAAAHQAGEEAANQLKQVLELTAMTLSTRVDDLEGRLSETITYVQAQMQQQQQERGSGGSSQQEAVTQQRVGALQAKVDEMGQALVLVTKKVTERMDALEASFSRATLQQQQQQAQAAFPFAPQTMEPRPSNPGAVQFDLSSQQPRASPSQQHNAAMRSLAMSEGGAKSTPGSPSSRAGSVSVRPKSAARAMLTEQMLKEKEDERKRESQLKSDEERIRAQKEAVTRRKEEALSESARNSPQRPMSAMGGGFGAMVSEEGEDDEWAPEPVVTRPQSAYGGPPALSAPGSPGGSTTAQHGSTTGGTAARRVRYEDDPSGVTPQAAAQDVRELLGARPTSDVHMADESYSPIDLNPHAQSPRSQVSGLGPPQMAVPEAPSLRLDGWHGMSEPGYDVMALEHQERASPRTSVNLSLTPGQQRPLTAPGPANQQGALTLASRMSAGGDTHSLSRMGALSLGSTNGRNGSPMNLAVPRTSLGGNMQAGFMGMSPMMMGGQQLVMNSPHMLQKMQSFQKAQMFQGKGGPNSDGTLPAHLRKL